MLLHSHNLVFYIYLKTRKFKYIAKKKIIFYWVDTSCCRMYINRCFR